MPVWEQYDQTYSFTVPATQSTQLFHNQEDTDNFQSADVVGVDGIVTVITNSDDLCRVRLVITPESMGSTNVELTPFHSPAQWYSWYVARGPLVFRLRSKKTVPPEHKLHMIVSKQQGSTSTVVNVGLMVLWVLKH